MVLLPVMAKNNLLLKIYCKNIVKILYVYIKKEGVKLNICSYTVYDILNNGMHYLVLSGGFKRERAIAC